MASSYQGVAMEVAINKHVKHDFSTKELIVKRSYSYVISLFLLSNSHAVMLLSADVSVVIAVGGYQAPT